jgi:translation initiation factor 5
MPVMQLKIEGRGNGIKTVILNIKEIAKSLNVEPIYPLKFIGIQLGTQTKWEPPRAIINGSHSLTTLSHHLDHFIKQFVLCARCHLPELIWKVGKSAIKTNCSACGHSQIIKETHKLVTFILKHPPTSSVRSIPSSSSTSVSSTLTTSNDTEEVEDWADSDDDSDAKEEVLPVVASSSIKELLERHEPHTRIASELRLLQLSRGWNDIQKYKYLLEAMFSICPKLDVSLLHHVAKDMTHKMSLFQALEDVIATTRLSQLIPIFHSLYDADFLEEEVFLCWYESPPESSITVSRPNAIALRKKAEPFIQWLSSNDSDSDE